MWMVVVESLYEHALWMRVGDFALRVLKIMCNFVR